MLIIIGLISAYLIGAIPTGYLVGYLNGLDVRQLGSGNIGFTNVKRALGWSWGLLTLVVDFGKASLFLWLIAPLLNNQSVLLWQVLCGVALILGNVFPCWLSFKGGKAVATGAGIFAVIFPWGLVVALIVFIIVVWITKYVSAGSLAAALSLILTRIIELLIQTNLLYNQQIGARDLLIIAMVLFVIIKHRANISRLINGTENKFFTKKPLNL